MHNRYYFESLKKPILIGRIAICKNLTTVGNCIKSGNLEPSGLIKNILNFVAIKLLQTKPCFLQQTRIKICRTVEHHNV